jgi:hypothetical protein
MIQLNLTEDGQLVIDWHLAANRRISMNRYKTRRGMKRAISISLGSSSRDKRVVINFKWEDVIVERIGTDGDIEKAKQLYHELDGKIDAFGVGGVDMYLRLEDHEYPL